MRNYFFYILFICVFTNSFGKNEDKMKSSGKEPVKRTRAFYEQEPTADIENLLSRIKNRNFIYSKPYNVNERSNKLMERTDNSFQKSKNKKNKNKVTFPNGGTIKSRISGEHDVNGMLRNSVNYVNITPEVYPLLDITDKKYDSREIASKKGIVRINNQYSTNNNDKLTKLANKMDTNNETFIRTATTPMSANFVLLDFLNKFNARSTNHLRPGNRVDKINNYLDALDNIGSKHRDNSKRNLLRSDVIDNVNSNLDTGKVLRTQRKALSHDQRPQPALPRPARRGDYRSRNRRFSSTQAGYTQDPDTCKTYNENLGKLWSNLSKLINIKEQPNDRALHNIAMMIQAYLEHQNKTQPPETDKKKNEGPKHKISETILRIRKVLDEAEGSAEKITKIILKYLKPDYEDVEIEDCQQINEEYLTLSVDLLYKNYLEKTDCQDEDDGITRNKKVDLRRKPGKRNIGHMTLSMANRDVKPHFQNNYYLLHNYLPTENESSKDFHKGKTQRLRSPNKNRRVFKPSRQQKSRPADRSGNQNERENLNTRSKSTSKKHKKSSLKYGVEKSICEKYATRKLVVSLRPVMERFNGLLECQLDTTLRSVNFREIQRSERGDSEYPDHRYAFKFYSNENSQRDRKVSPRFSIRNTGRKRDESHKKIYTERHGSSFENDQDVRANDYDDETDSVRVRKYSFDKTKSANPKPHVESYDTDARVSDNTNNENASYNDYDEEYFQTPPFYGDYDRVYKTHQNAFPSLINPSISLNDKKNTPSMSRSKQVYVTPGIAENDNHNEYEDDMTFNRDSGISAETNDDFFKQGTETSTRNTPFIDLKKLRSDDQLSGEKNKIHVKTFESIAEFLKRARDESMKTPEIAVPFALDTNKGYVELTHLIKYPKTLMYRPQFLVKNTIPYDDFLSIINNSNMTNDDARLMKIVRNLPNGSVQVLFETEDSEEPLEIRNLNDKDTRRSGSPDPVVDYDGVYKTQQNAFPSLMNPSISLNDKKNTPSMSRSKQVYVTPGIAENENHNEYEDAMTFNRDSGISAETNDDFFKQGTETSTRNTPFIDLKKLRSDDQLSGEKNEIHVKTFESIAEFLKRARDESMKTPEIAVPFALDTNKGYVELTHLIKYPKTLVYRPQFLVKNTIPYDDFLSFINNSNVTNDDARLMKIVRYLPNGSVQVLFETEDSEDPLEIRNLNDKDTRRSGSPDPIVDYQSESRIDTANENNNTDMTEEKREGFSFNYRNETRAQDFQSAVKSDSSSSDEYLSQDLDINTDSDTLIDNEELSQNSYFVDNTDTNSTSNSTPSSSESRSSGFSPLPILFSNHPSPDFGKEMGSSVASQIGSGIRQGLDTQTGSGMQMGLDPALNLSLKLNPVHPSQSGSFLSTLMPSHSNTQGTPNPSLNSQSHMDSNFDSPSGSYSASNSYSHLNSHSGSWSDPSHPQLPNTDCNNQEVSKNFSSSTQFIAQWWRKWKSVVKGIMKVK